MRIRYALLAGTSIMATVVGGLGTSGATAAQAATHPAAVHAPSLPAIARTLRPMLRDRQPASSQAKARPDAVYYTGLVELPDRNVLNAQGCGVPAHVIEYPYTKNGCDNNANETWNLDYLTDGYTAIYAYYGGHRMCLNVKGGSYTPDTQILAWGCDNGVYPGNEQFYLTNSPYSGWYYIHPAGNGSLCLNSAGGLGTDHNIILYGCGSYNNELFSFPGSTPVKPLHARS